VAFLFVGERMEEANAQELWDQEAQRLEAGDEPPEEIVEESEPEVVEETAPEPEPETVEEPDPFEGVPEIVRERLAKIDALEQANIDLSNQVKTAAGRVAAMQSEMAKRANAAESPTNAQIATAVKNPEKWDALKTDFPDWAEAMEEYVSVKLGAVQTKSDGPTPEQIASYVNEQINKTRGDMTRAIEEARIDGRYENWRDDIKTKEFSDWYVVQPREIRDLANSTSAKDAISMLDRFYAAKEKTAAEIKSARGQRLAVAATTRPGSTPPPRTVDDMNPMELWNFEAAQREKSRAARGF
jgi:hypothetical protein